MKYLFLLIAIVAFNFAHANEGQGVELLETRNRDGSCTASALNVIVAHQRLVLIKTHAVVLSVKNKDDFSVKQIIEIAESTKANLCSLAALHRKEPCTGYNYTFDMSGIHEQCADSN